MEGDRAVLRLGRMPAEGAVRSQGVLEVFQGDYQGSYEISPWPVTVDGTEITIRRDDWDMDRLYGKALAFGAPYSAARKLFPGITGAGFIT